MRQTLVEALKKSYERYLSGEEIDFLDDIEGRTDLDWKSSTWDLDRAYGFGDDFADAHYHRRKNFYGLSWPEAAELLKYLADRLERHEPVDMERIIRRGDF